MISQREAVFQLCATALPRLTPRLAEGVLISGFAGPPTRVGPLSLYDQAAVRRLAEAPVLEPEDLPTPCRAGTLVVRATGRAGWMQQPAKERLQHARGPFWFSPSVRLHLSLLLERQGFVCVVATVASYVLASGNVTAGRLEVDDRRAVTHLVVEPAGKWHEALRGRRRVTPPGNSWLWLTPTPAGQPSGTR